MWTAMGRSKTPIKEEKPLYYGHRSRLRKRFLCDYGASMADYEMLELLLTISIPRRDVKPLAKKLIAEFGDLSGVVRASYEELSEVEGVSKTTAALLKIIEAGKRRAESASLNSSKRNVISNWVELACFCREELGEDGEEGIYAFYFRGKKNYLGYVKIGEKATMAGVNKADLVDTMSKSGATSVAIVHNNPAEFNEPDNQEVALGKEMQKYLKLFNTNLLDYLILSKNNTLSFSHSGWL